MRRARFRCRPVEIARARTTVLAITIAVAAVVAVPSIVIHNVAAQDRTNLQLINAVQRVDAADVARLLNDGASANACAAARPPSGVVEWLGAEWSKLRGRPVGGEQGQPALQLILDSAAAKNRSGETDTQEAARTEIFRALMNHGADASYTLAGPESALSYAVAWNLPDVVQTLLQNGAPVDEMAAGCKSALIESKKYNEVFGGSQHPGAGCDTELMVCEGEDMTRLLLRYGADLNARGEGGLTPLLYQCSGWFGTADIAKVHVLLAAGARVNEKDDDGDTALICAVGLRQPNTLQLISLLCKYGADVTQKDSTGKNALDIAKSLSDEDDSPAVRREILACLSSCLLDKRVTHRK